MVWQKWATDSTTIQGFSLTLGTAAAVLDGKISWETAVPVVMGALVLIISPQNKGLAAEIAEQAPAITGGAALLAGDIQKVVTAYNMGQSHQAEKQALLPAAALGAFVSLTKGV